MHVYMYPRARMHMHTCTHVHIHNTPKTYMYMYIYIYTGRQLPLLRHAQDIYGYVYMYAGPQLPLLGHAQDGGRGRGGGGRVPRELAGPQGTRCRRHRLLARLERMRGLGIRDPGSGVMGHGSWEGLWGMDPDHGSWGIAAP